MTVPAAGETNLPVQYFGRPDCPRCGSALFVADESEFSPRGRIRHAWSCDDCGHQFVTAITLWPH